MNTRLPLDAKGAKDTRKTRKDIQNFENDWSGEVIGAAIEVQRVLGVGLLESAYAGALAIELNSLGIQFEKEAPVNATYKGRDLGVSYRADFVVEQSLILELKAVDLVTPLHRAQLLSYLRISGHKLGLLINFNAFPVAKDIHRIVNNFRTST